MLKFIFIRILDSLLLIHTPKEVLRESISQKPKCNPNMLETYTFCLHFTTNNTVL